MSLLTTFFANHKKKLFILALLAIIAVGSNFILGYNNPVEKVAEEAIKDETGVEVDFSPDK